MLLKYALFAAGIVFSISLYSIQPALPAIEDHFGAPLGAAWIGMSLPILGMVLGSLFYPLWARDVGRFMGLATILGGVAGIASAWAPDIMLWGLARFAQGLALAAIPGLAMAAMGALFTARVATMVGIFTGLSAIGAALGRMSAGILIEAFGVPVALTAIYLPALLIGPVLLSIKARVQLPKPTYQMRKWPLFMFGATLLFVNLLLSNLLPYRLTELGLSVGAIGGIFFVYLAATIGSGSGGWLSDKIGTLHAARVGIAIAAFGILLMAYDSVLMLVLGFAVVLFGVFATHAVGSGVAGSMGSGVAGTYVAAYYIGGGAAGVGYPVLLGHGYWAGLLVAGGALALALALGRRALLAPESQYAPNLAKEPKA
ncbi:MFS transporter [Roseinatronobacter thiooxidans]|uniref:MFS transporter n=1 Tax=Roseinatronobacter thiooxidans TaxID=121821 RepID=UPI0009FD21A2|nr:MFS transporter [Roseinatronobacter thiooxidans]